jgi:uroporphyrinogen-III synthase
MTPAANRGPGHFDDGTLVGVRVLVTRAADQADALRRPLAALGADVVEAPAIRVELVDAAPVMAALTDLGRYDWLVFTSRNAVRFFVQLLAEAGRDTTALGNLRVAAVGPSTAAALDAAGISVAVTPKRFLAEGLLEAMGARDDVRGRRVLYLVARGARDVLPSGLRTLGASVDVIPFYQSVPDTAAGTGLRQQLLDGAIDVITFTAGSAVRAFVRGAGADALRHAAVVTMGPATSAVVRELGLEVCAEADPSTLDGLIQAVVAAVR